MTGGHTPAFSRLREAVSKMPLRDAFTLPISNLGIDTP